MKLAVVVSFLNESQHLPALLASLDAQTRPPDQLLLVDDGSSDASAVLASEHASTRPGVRALVRPPRPAEPDRLSTAAELKAFLWGVAELEPGWDVVVKLDADLRLAEQHLEHVMLQFEADPQLGICGAYLAVRDGAQLCREGHPSDHVRGPNKFYRRRCFEDISPLPTILGWDTIDEITARMHGWTAHSVALPGGDSVHLRPTGLHDGRLRAMRRWGLCAWAYGATPATIVAGGLVRMRRPPAVLSGLNYMLGYVGAALRRLPRAKPAVLAWSRLEQRRRFARLLKAD